MPACSGGPASVRDGWLQQTNGLPRAVVLAFFLVAWLESFPTTAVTALLTDDIGMSLSTITTYYAFTFLPFMWKPAFGWLSDQFPVLGFHRIPYIAGSALGCAAGYLMFAFWVRSVWQAFVATLCLNSCVCFMQLMLGGFLVDIARQDLSNSVALQSAVNAAQWLGTLVSQIMALACYAHGGGASGRAVINARPAIAMTAVAPALIALMVPCLPEKRVTSAPACHHCCTLKREEARFAGTVALLQGNLVLIGCQSMMAFHIWWRSVAVALVASACVLAVAYLPGRCRAERQATATPILQASEESQQSTWWWVRLCLFCFAANAIPKSSVAVGQFQYAVFTAAGYQALSIISSAASITASLVFGRAFNRKGFVSIIALSALVAAAAGLAPWPFVSVALHQDGMRHDLWSTAGLLGVAATTLGAFASLFAVLPVDALVTSASGSVGVDRSCTAYAAFLACYNFGATVSGLVTSPLLEALGLDGRDWTALPSWIVATSAAKLLLLLFLPLLPPPCAPAAGPGPRSELEVGADGDESGAG